MYTQPLLSLDSPAFNCGRARRVFKKECTRSETSSICTPLTTSCHGSKSVKTTGDVVRARTLLFDNDKHRQAAVPRPGPVILGLVRSLHLSGLNKAVRPPTGTAELSVWATAAAQRRRPRALTSTIAAGLGKVHLRRPNRRLICSVRLATVHTSVCLLISVNCS